MLKKLTSAVAAATLIASAANTVAHSEEVLTGTDSNQTESFSDKFDEEDINLDDFLEENPGFSRYLKFSTPKEDDGTDTNQNGSNTERTRNFHRSTDARVGKLVWGGTCTAAHIGGRYWLTAKHCKGPGNVGFIITPNNSYAGIERWSSIDNHDMMLLRMGPGLDGMHSYKLPSHSIRNGTEVNITGCTLGYPSTSKGNSLGYVGETEGYWGMTKFKIQTGSYYIYGGDSGGPIYSSDGTLWSVLSLASDYDDSGMNVVTRKWPQYFWGNETFYHKNWIQESKDRLRRQVTTRDQVDAWLGRKAAMSYTFAGGDH